MRIECANGQLFQQRSDQRLVQRVGGFQPLEQIALPRTFQHVTLAAFSMSQKAALFTGIFAAPVRSQIKMARHVAQKIYGFWVTCSSGLDICPAIRTLVAR